MKNIRSNIIAAGILCLSLGMTSCTKGFLDVESKTESTTGNFYKTEQDAYRALWAATMVIDVQHVVALSISWLAPK